ncbi:WG repeat-containing protein [Rickettsia conorii]|uniref:WG repeat-containing protein n=1 Tax=Rickettsia conorii TaxID=781 RepID=UPI003AF1196C
MQDMQYEKTVGQLTESKNLNSLKLIKISPCKQFHTLEGKQLYTTKFLHVEKFHEPGLSPVYDKTGAYHINLKGEAAYTKRFNKTHGFYCGRAAVEDEDRWYHIDSHANRVYKQSYQWVGNYQDNICIVRRSNKFYHIDLHGNKLYQEAYDYVGDFKDDIAVVYKDGKATHINPQGQLIHNKWHKQLGIFHKGFAIAEDNNGWFHVNILGNAIYRQRYKTIEPFYNGLAMIKAYDGTLGQIDTTGNIKLVISLSEIEAQIHKISAELSGFWKTYLINVAIELDLLNILPATTELLSKQLGIIEPNLQRLLRALWEIELISYNQNKNLWQVLPKGELLKNSPFLPQATKMWVRVATEKNWLKITDLLKQKTIYSYSSFKEQETTLKIKTEFYQALIGYTKLDTREFKNKINIADNTNILLFGIHSLALIEVLINKDKNSINLNYYNDQEIPEELIKNYNVNLITQDNLVKNYDLSIFCRFLQNHDDEKVIFYLRLAKDNKITRILLIETILTDNSPIGGAVDINIMIETGGKLRKLHDWEAILTQVGDLKIFHVLPLTDYLSVIDIRYQ